MNGIPFKTASRKTSVFLAVLGEAWIAKAFPSGAKAGGGLFVAVLQMAIALGPTAGGLIFGHGGYQSTFAASAAIADCFRSSDRHDVSHGRWA